ncbi:MAG: TonB-dependent receptor domain-containing protein, partial [Acidimicrobiia bacterium]
HFFFANYDGQRSTQPNPVFLNLPAATPSDPDTLAGIAKLAPIAQSWVRTQDQDAFLVKTDHQINPNHRLTLRYNHQNFTGEGFESGGPQNSFEHTGASKVFSRTVNVAFTSVLRPNLFNETRFQYARDREPGEANSANPEAAVRQGGITVLTIGRNFFSPRETTIDRWQIADNLTYLRGQHKVKAGFDLIGDDIFNLFQGNFSGSYTFQSLASFNLGRPNVLPGERYIQAFPGPGTSGPITHPDIREWAFFAQDEWRISRDTTLNVGIRYDLQKFAKPPIRNPDAQLAAAGIDTSSLNTDANNWGPRLGIAWSPAGRSYVVRAGYGLFYGRTPSIMVGTAHSNNGINVQTIEFTGASVPTYPQKFDSPPAGVTAQRPTIFIFDTNYENARVQQASTGFEYQLMSSTAVSVNYLFV